MKNRLAQWLTWLVILSTLASVVAGCGAQPTSETPPTAVADAPAATDAPQPTEAPAAEKVVNALGVELPADAAPLEEQVLYQAITEGTYNSWDQSVYDSNWVTGFPHDSCLRPDKDYELHPSGCDSWEISEDGLTFTFHLPKDKVWSDGEPVTAEDWVFTLQRYARADFDFEWYYGMLGIVNWGAVVSGDLPPEELGAKVVDDYTFTVTTDQPTPFLLKQFADVWVAPKHVVKDRLATEDSWAANPETAVSCGPFKLDHWDKGKEIVYVLNETYTGPYKPLISKIVHYPMTTDVRYTSYKAGDIDLVGEAYGGDLPPAAMAEIMADPELKKQLIQWPHFLTFYLFFDNQNPPFDNLKVRQAFSHAINRDAIINGPLQYQSVAAYTLNPPGFPGESVDALKGVQNFDPELAAKLMEEAGYPNGEGFPKQTLYLRNPFPALVNVAEMIGAMLKESLGVEVEVMKYDYSIYMETLRAQKKDQGGEMLFSLVPYEYDFVDGSNFLGVFGGCEDEGADLPNMPGRHTWYNKEFNDLVCQANGIMGDEAARNALYQQAEKILVEDVGLIPIYHPVNNVMVNPKLSGPALEPNKLGVVSYRGMRASSSPCGVYKTK